MASRIPDLLSDSPPPELLSESTHSDLLGSYTPPILVHATSPPQQQQQQHQHQQQQQQQQHQQHQYQHQHQQHEQQHHHHHQPASNYSDRHPYAYLSKPTPPSGTATPPSASSSPSSSGFLGSYPTFSRMASSLQRRLTDPDAPFFSFAGSGSSATGSSLLHHSQHEALSSAPREKRPAPATAASASASLGNSAVFQPPSHRSESPFSPPPLTGLSLLGLGATARPGAQLLNLALAEEIRLLLPPRLQLSADWALAFSVERDGVSLHTLYDKCATAGAGGRARGGWVLAVRDGGGSVFGAYLTDAPHPSSTYYGTGECFLWRASMVAPATMQGHMPLAEKELMDLPPPPSEDTSEYTQRHVTLASPTSPRFSKANGNGNGNGNHHPEEQEQEQELLRFKAFPYSGINDYLIYCEADYLSVGGGDGRYGLWLDSSLEKGVSSPCMTFGNECLAEEGEKFEILGVEAWFVAA